MATLPASPALAQAPAAHDPAAPVHLDYALYGHGFHVMDVEVALQLTPAGYAITLHNHTTGLVGMLVHADLTSVAAGRFDGVRAKPSGFSSSGVSRGARRMTRIAYPGDEPQVQLLIPLDTDRDPVPVADTVHSIDTLSAVVSLVQSVAHTGRCDGVVRLFDGLRLSTLQATTVGQQTLPPSPNSPYAGTALACDFVGRQIGGFLHDADLARNRRPQHGTAWLAVVAPGVPPVPIRVTFQNPRFGAATLFLTSVH